MSYIEKGIILTIEGETDRNENPTRARVQSKTAEGTTTLPLIIPWYLRGSMGMLEKGTEVVYAHFDDATGIILARMDGNWEGKMEESQLFLDLMGSKGMVQGSIDVSDGVIDSGICLSTHTHGGVEHGDYNTEQPNGGK